MDRRKLEFCEEWIGWKLFERLQEYKKRYPKFDDYRFACYVETQSPKTQRFMPYAPNEEIAAINKSLRKSRSISNMANNSYND